MSEYTCTRCGCEVATEDHVWMEETLLCPDCAESYTSICDRCGRRIWTEDEEGDDNQTLCSNCFTYHYTSCESCSRLIPNCDAYHLDDNEDESYCYSCYQRHKPHIKIHEYSYKPEPIFYGEGNRFFGVELEIDDGGKDSEHAKILLELGNQNGEHLYIKSDGSLEDGMEIVTHPMTLDYHCTQMPWQALTRKALALGYYSHKAETCGLHVHVNRDCFGETRELQENCISRVLFIVERFWEELLLFSRRTQSQLDRWAARYGYKHSPQEILAHAKKCGAGRYTCVNLVNYNTIEFRIFRGTLRTNTILATLQMVDAICSLAVKMDEHSLLNLSWPLFVDGLDSAKMPELVQYLKERRLYLNEPVEVVEED